MASRDHGPSGDPDIVRIADVDDGWACVVSTAAATVDGRSYTDRPA